MLKSQIKIFARPNKSTHFVYDEFDDDEWYQNKNVLRETKLGPQIEMTWRRSNENEIITLILCMFRMPSDFAHDFSWPQWGIKCACMCGLVYFGCYCCGIFDNILSTLHSIHTHTHTPYIALSLSISISISSLQA